MAWVLLAAVWVLGLVSFIALSCAVKGYDLADWWKAL